MPFQTRLVVFLFVAVAVALATVSLRADYLTNTDFSADTSGWLGDGQAAYLKPDGTEGSQGDANVTPVIRLTLIHGHEQTVHQNFTTDDDPAALLVKVDVYASNDFARSKFPNDYSPLISNWRANSSMYMMQYESIELDATYITPDADFWIYIAAKEDPAVHFKLAQLRPGSWVTVTGLASNLSRAPERVVAFCVPPGNGVVYLKNPSLVNKPSE